ncbi:c-type cytochrome [Segnochrobactraceae bacterium EtOH-i3]
MRTLTALALAALVSLAAVPGARADGDAAAGEKVFIKCKACHMVGPDAKNRVGPELNGVIGRVPGTLDTFAFSPAMKDFGVGKVWDEATLTDYLTAPRKVVTGTKMVFVGLPKPQDVANVIAYLASFNADGSPKTADAAAPAAETPAAPAPAN